MKIAFIVITAGESQKTVKKLIAQIKGLRTPKSRIYHIKNRRGEEGYARGVNKGVSLALKQKPDIFIILNPDLSLMQLDAKKLLEPAGHFDIWGFAMKQRDKRYYGGKIDKWRMSGGLIDKKPHLRFVNRDFVSGSLICFKSKVMEKIGLWDEKYFLYYEEVDYCFRARRAGFKVGIDSRNIYEHFEVSDSTNALKDYYLRKNRLRFLLKYGSPRQKFYELIRVPKSILENRQGFLFNFLSLNTSSILNKVFTFILFLFLIRLLSPSDYGLYTLIWVQLGLLAPLADFGTTSYGILQQKFKRPSQFNNLFSMRAAFSALAFILTFALAFLLRFSSQAIFFLLLASPVFLANAFSGSLLILTSLKKKAYLTSILSIIFNFFLSGILILLLYLSRNLGVVFQGIFIFYLIYTFINLFVINRESDGLSLNTNFFSWLKILKHSSIFVLISFFAGLYFRLDVFLLNYFKGQQAIGIYSAGYKFFDALTFIPASYNIVSIPILSTLLSNSRRLYLERVKRDFLFLGLFGVIFALILAYLAPFFLKFILKGDFTSSIAVFQIVIFALPLLLVTSVMLNGLYILKKASAVVYLFLLQVIINAGLNWIFIPKYSYIASSYITVVSEMINLFIVVILFKYFFKNYRARRA